MTEQPPSAIGTVAQEAARLIEDMATMARSNNSPDDDPRGYADGPAHEPASPETPPAAGPAGDHEETGQPREEVCSECGGERGDTPASCRICPLCRGISLLRSVRPETVDLLADLALSVAASLRDVAARTRASEPAPSHRSGNGSTPDTDRDHVQDIKVDDESEG